MLGEKKYKQTLRARTGCREEAPFPMTWGVPTKTLHKTRTLISKTDKPLATMMKQEGEKKQITNIEKGGGDITTDPIDTERKTEYCKLYSNRSDILTEMEKRNP